GFDGEKEVNDIGTKATYKVITTYFDADHYPDASDFFYSADGEDGGGGGKGLFGSILNVAGGIGGKVLDSQHQKKYGTSDLIAKKADAKNQIIQSVLAQRQAQIDTKQKATDQKAKTMRTVLIVGGSVIGVAAIVGLIYYFKTSKK
ncbi:MAG TPA: hypothetical protein VNX68_10625, partial [Nitrosopumilaceae archaeon]|nr:hypothetical protein [Nitrosopumilaceae archaeon]